MGETRHETLAKILINDDTITWKTGRMSWVLCFKQNYFCKALRMVLEINVHTLAVSPHLFFKQQQPQWQSERQGAEGEKKKDISDQKSGCSHFCLRTPRWESRGQETEPVQGYSLGLRWLGKVKTREP